MSTKEKEPRIILRNGKPEAVILDIEEYQEMLERLEDIDDLEYLKELRKRPLNFKKLEDFLEEKLVKVMRIRHRREVYQ
jgi:PHD/YefM family antitoxin component YafN of YafNO toxin-antitoxin module